MNHCFLSNLLVIHKLVLYSSKIILHLLDILKCESSACRVLEIISINSSYSIEIEAQWKVTPCCTIVWTSIACLGDFFISNFHFLILLNIRRNTHDRLISCNSRSMSDTFDVVRFPCLPRDTNSNKQ